MNKLSVSAVLLLHVALHVTGAEADGSGMDYPTPDYTSLKPSLAVVIGILSIMFVLTFLLLMYAKFCHKPARPTELSRPSRGAAVIGSSRRLSGIDKAVIESLPFFRFSALKGSKAGLECSVCLAKFEEIEILRLLPKCKHAFHVDCIDRWLESHSSCPLCRRRVGSEDALGSTSFRFSGRQPPEPGAELFVQREESRSGRLGSSEDGSALIGEGLDKHKHRILAAEIGLKSRWSNLSSSDLITLRSEMLLEASSGRFDSAEVGPTRQRSASEITAVSRYEKSGPGEREERIREVWLPIARKTVQWFANRDQNRSDQWPQNQQRQSLDV